MNRSRLFGLALLLVILSMGIWALAGNKALAPESAARRQALERSLAPATTGDGSSGTVVGKQGTNHEPVAPVVVNITKVPTGLSAGESQYERWLRGEIDMDEQESYFSPVEIAALQAEALLLEPSANVQQIDAAPGLTAPAIITSFASIDIDDCCVTGVNVPPDPEMAAGPNHVIAVVNVSFDIYDKSGTSLLGTPMFFANFMGSNPNCASGVFDPNVLYDEEADRFILGIDGSGDYYCVAVSQTPDPMGSWNVYAFSMDAAVDDFFDYPHAGVGDDAIYMGANIFGDSSDFRESRIYAFDKSAMYAGSSASFVSHDLAGTDFTPQPINLHGWSQATWPSGRPHYILTAYNFNGSTHGLYTWDDPFGADVLTLETVINLNDATGNNAAFAVPAPNPPSGQAIEANDVRPLDFEYRNGYGWTTLTIGCNPGSGTVDCVRWAQIDLDTFAVVQAGDFGSNGDYRTFPDLAVNHCGDMAVGYSRLNNVDFPSVYATGRQADDPLGTVQAEVLLKAGEETYYAYDGTPLRWGDYTGMTIDPDGRTFWYLGEYAKNVSSMSANWGTYIGAFQYATCDVAPDFSITATPTSLDVCVPDEAVYDVALTSLVGYSEPVTLSAQGAPTGSSVSFDANPVVPSDSVTMTVTTNGTTAGAYALSVVGVAPTRTHTTTVTLNLFDDVPSAALPITPADGALNQSLRPVLTWAPAGGAASYIVEVSTDAAFGTIVESAIVDGTSYQLVSELELESLYYWRVIGQNACGEGTTSKTSTFTTVGAQVVCPVGTTLTSVFDDDFDPDAPGWTHNSTTGPDTWTLSIASPSPGSGSNAYRAIDYGLPSDQRLVSPPIDLPAGKQALTLQFLNEQNFEDPAGSGGCWDGGLLEITTDGGSSWTQLDSELLSDPYDGVGNNGPPANLNIWCGESNGFQAWTNSIVNLDGYAGETVQLRFRAVSDAAVGAEGWYVDDVQVTYCNAVTTSLPLLLNP
jgi:hypothetical protein